MLYSLLLGYEEAPEGFELDDGVYYNKLWQVKKLKCPIHLMDGLVEYSDGTVASRSSNGKRC